jgi:AcrR family transcriptional regulator
MTMPTNDLEEGPRRQRSDGIRTREQILMAAAALATVDGLDRLSIGGLADHIGISKSGLYAHFRSKEALQLATIETAWAIFDREVVRPALRAEPGRPTVIALVDAYADHLERRVFPGGCFFAATAAEFHMRPSRIATRLEDFDRFWMGLLRTHVEIARDAGDLATDADPDQIVYEIESHVLNAHLRFPTRGDRLVLERTRRAVRDRLGLAAAD